MALRVPLSRCVSQTFILLSENADLYEPLYDCRMWMSHVGTKLLGGLLQMLFSHGVCLCLVWLIKLECKSLTKVLLLLFMRFVIWRTSARSRMTTVWLSQELLHKRPFVLIKAYWPRSISPAKTLLPRSREAITATLVTFVAFTIPRIFRAQVIWTVGYNQFLLFPVLLFLPCKDWMNSRC